MDWIGEPSYHLSSKNVGANLLTISWYEVSSISIEWLSSVTNNDDVIQRERERKGAEIFKEIKKKIVNVFLFKFKAAESEKKKKKKIQFLLLFISS